MSSKRRLRKQEERKAREVALQGGTGMLKDGQVAKSQSFADRILNRVHDLHNRKPQEPPALVSTPAPPPKMGMPTPRVTEPPDPGETAILQSRLQKEMIWKMAQENQDHYILMQMEDKAMAKPWFMYPKYVYQYSEFVMLTPEMAKKCLEHLWAKEEGNRNKKPHLVEAYKRDIQNGHWIPTDESIGINLSFEVYNGQHRLWAIIEANQPMPLYFTWNVLDEAKFFIESGAIRTLSERLKMAVEPRLGNRTSGFCKAIMRGVTNRSRWTNAEIADFACKWDSLLVWVAEHIPIARAEVQAAIAKAYLWYGGELIEPFCHRLRNIKFPDDGDPAKALYTSLQNAKKNRSNVTLVAYKKTLQAIAALMNDREISKLYEKDEDIFHWLPGWELPPRPTKLR